MFCLHVSPTTPIHSLSLHDALPISSSPRLPRSDRVSARKNVTAPVGFGLIRAFLPGHTMRHKKPKPTRSEEHTSELQSRQYIVCRLLLETKKQKNTRQTKQHYSTLS